MEVKVMNSQRKILEMLADKKITVDEAERLMAVMQPDNKTETEEIKGRQGLPKYLRVMVKPAADNKESEADNVNIRVPISLVRAGMKFASVLPPSAYNQVDSALKEKGLGFDLRNIKPENIEELISALNDLEVDVHNGRETVHIYAE
jgi:hypothetical protein